MDRAPWGNILTIDDSNQELNIDDKVTIVENIFREHIDKHAPLKEIIVKKPINSSWMTDEILSLMDTRDKYKNMYNRYKENFFSIDIKNYVMKSIIKFVEPRLTSLIKL